MATPVQVAAIIDIMQQQSQQVATLLANQQNQQQQPQQVQQQPPQGNERVIRTKRPDRPLINSGIDDREWMLFTDTWSRYKTMIGAQDGDADTIRMELRTACSTDLNKMLFEFVGPETLNTCSETEMLAHIKSIAVKETHPEVHQTSFNLIKQEQGETITHYVARLKAKAFLCKFEVPCTCCTPPQPISYAEKMVAQRLVAGLANLDHQRKILAEAPTLTTLALKVKRLQLLETTEESASVLQRHPTPTQPSETTEASVSRSRYKKEKAPPKVDHPPNANDEHCQWCGRTPHTEENRRKSCPAFGKRCKNCDIKGHLATVCRKSKATSAGENEPTDDATDTDGLISSDASVSFAFGAQQDFRPKKPNKGKT